MEAVIAHEASAWWGADALAEAYAITKDTSLSNIEATFWLCHKLAIEPTFLPHDARCDPGCNNGNRASVPKEALQHGWHQASCSLHGFVTLRHDRYLEEIANTMRKTLGLLAVTGKYLNKDYDTWKTTDLYIVFPGSIDELPVSVDYTCHCPFLPVYRQAAHKDFKSFMQQRNDRKTEKHFHWCDNHTSKRLFIAAAGTTLGGTGGKPFWDLIDKVFARAIIKDQLIGGTGYGVQEQRRLFMQRLQSIIVRYTAQGIAALSGVKRS